jgi:cytochrome c oxidase assembly protein subunit 11
MQQADKAPRQSTRIHLVLAAVAIFMFGFAFALVPIYDTLCRALGINGKIEQIGYRSADTSSMTPAAREVRVELVTTNSERLSWRFYPLVGAMTVHPGEMHELQFYAKNNSGRSMTIRAIPSVTPSAGASYLVKTDCFCFRLQTLEAGASMKMPLAFHVSPELPEKYRTLTLSYALFEVAPE